MLCKLALPLTLLIWNLSLTIAPQPASAETPLTRAVIERLRNQVRLIPKNQPARSARVADVMKLGDSLTTARSSLADIRFNDGSLARLGEQALFQFIPGTRTFYLSNGTVLLLIPPGKGRTIIRTPSAAAGIRGSALFVRHITSPNPDIPEKTVIASLTDSGIEIFTEDGTQSQVLPAGQLAVISQNRIERYEFDMETFYNTSQILEGLNLTQTNSTTDSGDSTLAQVRAEIAEARARQQSFGEGNDVVVNPAFVRLERSTTNLSNPSTPSNGFQGDVNQNKPTEVIPSLGASPTNSTDVPGLVGDRVRATQTNDRSPNAAPPAQNPTTNTNQQPSVQPPTTQALPQTQQLPTTQAPSALVELPVQQPPTTQQPPVQQPPVQQPPVQQLPVQQLPTTQEPGALIELPVQQPPTTQQPPVQQTPVQQPPVQQLPTTQAPSALVELPVQQPPTTQQPPVQQPPVQQPPIIQTPGDDDRDDFPGQGNGGQNGFPGQGNGVQNGFPGQGNGVQNGFPGQGAGQPSNPTQGNSVETPIIQTPSQSVVQPSIEQPAAIEQPIQQPMLVEAPITNSVILQPSPVPAQIPIVEQSIGIQQPVLVNETPILQPIPAVESTTPAPVIQQPNQEAAIPRESPVSQDSTQLIPQSELVQDVLSPNQPANVPTNNLVQEPLPEQPPIAPSLINTQEQPIREQSIPVQLAPEPPLSNNSQTSNPGELPTSPTTF